MNLHRIKNKILKKGADDVILTLRKSKEKQIKFTNNNITSINSWCNEDISVFCSINKKLVVTSLEDFSEKKVKELIKNIFRFQKALSPNKDYLGIAKGPFRYKTIKNSFDKKILNLDGIDLVEKSINTAINNSADRCSGLLEHSSFERTLLNSNNIESKDKGTNYYFSIRAFNGDGSGHKVNCGRMLNNLKTESIAKKASFIAKESKNPVKIKTGTYDVVFDPMIFANILNHVALSSSIASVESGFSFLMDKLNNKVANDNVTIFDDATLPNGFNSAKFDEEGVPTRKNNIIDKGTLKTYLYNTSYAKKYNTKTTANAGIIDPHPSNIILKKGDYSKEELIKEVKKGLYITNTWYTRFQNHIKGDFSTIPRDGIFYIENGKIKHPVKEIRISDNMLHILRNIEHIGNKSEHIYGWEAEIPTITPAVLVKHINITKSTS